MQIEALQAQLEEQTKLAKEQIESLLEDRRVRIEEYDVQRKRDEERLKQAQEKSVIPLIRYVHRPCLPLN